jgi:hypothetical protein
MLFNVRKPKQRGNYIFSYYQTALVSIIHLLLLMYDAFNVTLHNDSYFADDYDSDEVMCREKDETDQCTIYFLYGQNPDKSNYVFAQRTKECPFEAPLQWIAVGIISLVLLIGLIVFIIWKVVTLIKDRAEFAEFQKESVGAAFGTVSIIVIIVIG